MRSCWLEVLVLRAIPERQPGHFLMTPSPVGGEKAGILSLLVPSRLMFRLHSSQEPHRPHPRAVAILNKVATVGFAL